MCSGTLTLTLTLTHFENHGPISLWLKLWSPDQYPCHYQSWLEMQNQSCILTRSQVTYMHIKFWEASSKAVFLKVWSRPPASASTWSILIIKRPPELEPPEFRKGHLTFLGLFLILTCRYFYCQHCLHFRCLLEFPESLFKLHPRMVKLNSSGVGYPGLFKVPQAISICIWSWEQCHLLNSKHWSTYPRLPYTRGSQNSLQIRIPRKAFKIIHT